MDRLARHNFEPRMLAMGVPLDLVPIQPIYPVAPAMHGYQQPMHMTHGMH